MTSPEVLPGPLLRPQPEEAVAVAVRTGDDLGDGRERPVSLALVFEAIGVHLHLNLLSFVIALDRRSVGRQSSIDRRLRPVSFLRWLDADCRGTLRWHQSNISICCQFRGPLPRTFTQAAALE